MPSFSEFAKQYAARIKKAVDNDSVGVALGRIKSASAFTRTDLGDALREVGGEFEGLVYAEGDQAGQPLSEDDKQKIADEIAERLGWNQPRTLRRLIKGGSVDSLMNMSQEMENLFLAVRK